MVKNLPANAGDRIEEGSIPGLERSPGGGYGDSLSILAWSIPWTEEAWWATVHRVAKSQT